MSLLPNLDEMTDNEKLAVLESIQKSIAQSKEIQKKKIGENVDLVVQALKKIESDIRDRFDSVGNSIEKRVLSIKDGRDGINGKDGRDGKDGRNGKDGLKGDKGDTGQAGRDGIDGVDGVSVVNANIDFDGSLIITLSSGQQINVGEVVSQDVVEKLKIITSGGAGSGGGGSGTVTSVALSGGTTGLTVTGSPITTAGTITLAGTLAVANGGTGGTTASTARSNLLPTYASNAGKVLAVNSGATDVEYIAVGGTGTVTSVAATVPSFLSVAGSPITGSGTLAITLSGTALPVANGGTGATTAGGALTSLGAIGSIASADASIIVTQVGSAVDLAVSQTSPASVLVEQVRNATGATLTKGTAVYISGATGQIPTVSKALADADVTSAQTLGVITADISNNSNGYVTIIGLVSNLDTSAYTDGAQLYLSPTTAGTLTATKPYAPQHLVYMAVVAHAHPTHGKLLVKVQNGYELDELHNVSAQSPTTGQTIVYNSSTSLWEKNTVSLTAGVNGTLPIANGGTGTTSTTFVNAATNVTGTLPIANGGTGITSFGTGVATFLGTPSSANLAAVVTDETGTGALVFANSPTLVTPALGTPSSGTLSSCTVDGTNEVGFKNIPQNSQSAAYTLVLADAGKHIFHPSTDANARTYTIPANSSVAYPIGTAITFINMTSQVVTIAITTDTMYLSSAGTTGSRSLAQYGSATAIKITSTNWLISGSGLT